MNKAVDDLEENPSFNDAVENRYRRLLEAAPDGILEVDARGRIILMNSQAEHLFGYRREELLGKPVEILIPERFRRRHPAHQTGYRAHPMIRPMGSGLDLRALRADGTEFAVDINLSPFENENGPGVICVVRDVTDRKAAEEQIQLLNQRLEIRNREVERANYLKSSFLAIMSHELRTPLNAIIGFAALLDEQDCGPLTPKQQRFVEHIQEGGRHLLALVNDVLDLSKIEAGRIELKYDFFELSDAVEQALANLRPLAISKRIELVTELIPNVTICADLIRFKQVLYNLLSNAIKFTPEGGSIQLTARTEAEWLRMCVSDTGIGIQANEQLSVFEPFHQLSATTSGVREGTGLGLSITKGLIEQHGGAIWVESEPGEGSQFHFTVPLKASVSESKELAAQ